MQLFLCGLFDFYYPLNSNKFEPVSVIQNEPTTLGLRCRLQVFLVMHGAAELWVPGFCLQSKTRQIGSICSTTCSETGRDLNVLIL